MDNESIQISMSAEEFRQFAQLIQTIQSAMSGGQMGCQPLGRFVTVEDHIKKRWWLATPKDKRRARDVFLAKYRQELKRDALKLTGHDNGAFIVELENIAILDEAIDLVRNEADLRRHAPLFDHPRL